MKTIITLDKANQPYGFPQLNENGNFDNIIVESGVTATTISATTISATTISATTYLNLPSTSSPISVSGTTLYSNSPATSNFSTTEGIFLGSNAGFNATNANQSNFIGIAAGQGATYAEVSNIIGNSAGAYATNAYYSNFIGAAAGYQAQNSSYSTLLGTNVGRYNSSPDSLIGTNNIIIGTNITLHNGATNSLNIGGVLFGSGFYFDSGSTPTFLANTEGKIGIGIVASALTNTLHISASTDPLRIEGLTADTSDTNLLSVNGDGVIHTYPLSGLTGNSTSSTFTGGTVSGATNFTNGLTANTISATTYYNLPTDIRVTGGTYAANIGTITFTNNTGGTFTVSGWTYVADSTVSGNTFTTTNNLGQVASFTPNAATGGTYSNGTITLLGSGTLSTITGFPNSFPYLPLSGGTVTGGTIFQSGLTANTISATTYYNLPDNVTGKYLPLSGGTVTGGTIFQSGVTANTISATTYQNLPTDIRVTGGTYTNGTITFTNNTGGTFNVTGLSTGGGGGQVFYLNLSQSKGSNRYLSTTASTASQQTSGVTIASNATSSIASFQSDQLGLTLIPGGIWSFYLHSYKQNSNASFDIFVEVYKITSGSSQTLLFQTDPAAVTTNSPNPSMQLTDGYYSGTTLDVTDSIIATVRATNTGNQSHVITLVTEGTQHYSYGISTLPTQQGLTCDTLSGCSIIQTIQTNISNKFDKSGGTVSGATNFISGLTANTISATTYSNLPSQSGTGVSAFSYNQSTGLLTITKNDTNTLTAGTFSYVTATTLSAANVLSVASNGTSATTTTINAVTGGTYSNGTITLSGTGGVNGNTITGFPTSLTGAYLPLSGGTVTGGTIFQSGLTANTISATTYSNLPSQSGTGISAFTYVGSTGLLTITKNDTTTLTAGTFSYVTAVTESANVITVTSNGGSPSTYTIDAVTGGTYSSGTITLSGTGNVNGTQITGLPTTASTIYTADDIITSNRTVNLSSYTLSFSSSTSTNNLMLSGGSVGIGTATPTNKLTVSAVTDPVKFVGLQSASDTSLLTVDGTGVIHTLPTSSVGLSWNNSTATQSATSNNGYVGTATTLTTITLPSTAAFGSIVEVVGTGTGLWRISQNASQSIKFGIASTTSGTGGYLSATSQYDCVKLLCTSANTTFVVTSSIGNIFYI